MKINTEGFKERLECVLVGGNKAALCREAGIAPQILNRWLHSDYNHLPAADFLASIAEVLGVRLMWLIAGEGPMRPTSHITVADEEFIKIPEFTVRASAEGEIDFDQNVSVTPALYRLSFFKTHNLSPASCKRFKAVGDSMAPLINNGDLVLVECANMALSSPEALVSGAIYAYTYRNELIIRRVYVDYDDVIIAPENRNGAYQTRTFPFSEFSQKAILIGRVIERCGIIA